MLAVGVEGETAEAGKAARYEDSSGCESETTSVAESARLKTRRSARAPAKSEPALVDASPLQPTRSVDTERVGSEIAAGCTKRSAPSRKPLSWKGAAEGE